MVEVSSERLHASCVAIDGCAILIEGPSGSGKSDLALRLIDRGAILVSDDYTIVRRATDGLVASAPATIVGRLEIRGVGIVALPHATDVPVALLVRLDVPVPRLPEVEQRVLLGRQIRCQAFAAFEASTPIKIEYALRQFGLHR